MNEEAFKIYNYLLNHPGMMHVTPDKRRVYMLDDDQKKMYVFVGDFRDMTVKELNQVICAKMEHC